MSALAELMAGSCIGKYKLIRVIGYGGYCTVYEAQHDELKHRVAIKILRSEDPKDREPFIREAKILARLTYVNVVSLLEFGYIGGYTPYMVLALGKPCTTTDLPVPVNEVLSM